MGISAGPRPCISPHAATTVTVIDQTILRRQIALQDRFRGPDPHPPICRSGRTCLARRPTTGSRSLIGDCCDYDLMRRVVRDAQPEAIIHLCGAAERPRIRLRDYRSAALTLDNNLKATFNAAWAVIEEAPDAHIVKLGTMGEYGTPSIDIGGRLDRDRGTRAARTRSSIRARRVASITPPRCSTPICCISTSGPMVCR